jgi:hypothetical protein
MDTCAKNLIFLRPSQLGRNMGWYLGELPQPPVIPALFFLFHFFEQMDTGRDVHWGMTAWKERDVVIMLTPGGR